MQGKRTNEKKNSSKEEGEEKNSHAKDPAQASC